MHCSIYDIYGVNIQLLGYFMVEFSENRYKKNTAALHSRMSFLIVTFQGSPKTRDETKHMTVWYIYNT